MIEEEIWGSEDTTTSKRRRSDHHGRATLRVLAADQVQAHKLPDEGEICLGRGVDAHVVVNLPDISRRHAMVRLGSDMAVYDLGSANGTYYRGERLRAEEWTALEPDDWFSLGDATIVIATSGKPRRSVGQERMLDVIDKRLSAHRRDDQSFAVVSMRCVTTLRWCDVVEAMLGGNDHLAVLGDASAVLFVAHRSPERLRLKLEAIEEHLQRLGARPTVHTRVCPDDGDDVDALLPTSKDRRKGATTLRPPVPLVRSPAMKKIHELVAEVAPSMATILILGDTGVGKEVLARAIHDRSPRKPKPFLAINCAALSENLLESELFGYERGAFTGAVASKPGLLETAEGGTLFLDELGEMPRATQAKLLRVLEERKVWRLGALKPKRIDVRIVAATNRNLQDEVNEGRFRADLFYRLNGISFTIPALRARIEEIEPLAEQFSRLAAKAIDKPRPTLSPEAISALQGYAWPGNIRELRNAVERAVLLSRNGVITVDELPEEVRSARHGQTDDPVDARTHRPPEPDTAPETIDAPLQDTIEKIEKRRIIEALEKCGGNQTRAAKELGITRRMLISRLERYDIPRPRAQRRSKKKP